MRSTTIGTLALEMSNSLGCTHQEAVVEICCRHRLAEIPSMPVVVFSDGTVERLHREPLREIETVKTEIAQIDFSLVRKALRDGSNPA